MKNNIVTPINKVEPDSIEKVMNAPKVYTQQEFGDMYLSLCKQTKWQISGEAGLKPMNDLGGYLIGIQLKIIPFVEQK